ncbi:LAMI_0D00386g1_1 [Lachancea mirantina]|uniref:LAMI_0D00386g1_1 n=1 Tax=Lachancea mirantina TaxID=1230905 RepID=A0A1G4J895_9SACH|nr:LAMI_0D00386g1_1 [Lachancea mirantina]
MRHTKPVENMADKKKRSRGGCKNCKRSKIKCDETKPKCLNCLKKGSTNCDYSIVLVWGGRPFKSRKRRTLALPHTTWINGVLKLENDSVTEKLASEMTSEIITRPDAFKTEFIQDDLVPSEQTFISNDCCSLEPSTGGLQLSNLHESSLSTSEMGPFKASTPPQINLRSLHLPDPRPAILTQSSYYSEIFDFYLKETAHLFVPAPRTLYAHNPFHTILPQMAMRNSTLMNLLLAFGINHRLKFIIPGEDLAFEALDETSSLISDGRHIVSNLLTRTLQDLLNQLILPDAQHSDMTLITIMMFAGFDIFFSDARYKWRSHIYGARRIMRRRLEASSQKSLAISHSEHTTENAFFTTMWFSYLNIISVLSSVNTNGSEFDLSGIKYDFSAVDDVKSIHSLRVRLKDIEYFTGLDLKNLSFLAGVASLLSRAESSIDSTPSQAVIVEAFELSNQILRYLDKSEREREEIYQEFFAGRYDSESSRQYEDYKTLRATNLIFGLTGALQLLRRVIGMQADSELVRDILQRITILIKTKIPIGSSTAACITFCLFCCGSELHDESSKSDRQVYTDNLSALGKRGMTSAYKANLLMRQCWHQKKAWWIILQESNLDINFAL